MKLSELVTINPISKETAKQIIEKYHYSHLLNRCSYALGVYYKKDDHNFFSEHGELIGCIVYSSATGRLSVKSLAEELESDQVLELTRLFIHDGYEKNIESHVIGQSFHWIKKNCPEVEVLISYSDPEQGHLGIIYQATNWLYQGTDISLGKKTDVSLTENPYKWMHSRTVNETYGTASVDKLKEILNRTFWIKQSALKHRYIYILKNKKHWMKQLKHPILPYPKAGDLEMGDIQKIEV